MKNRIVQLALCAVLLFCLTGCGFIDYFYLPPPEDTAQELYESGRDAMKEKKYYEAIGYFEKLKDRYPFSPYTPQGLIALGDAYYLDEQYGKAVDTYKEFESLHPRNEEIPYVLYQIGMANFSRNESIDKPQEGLEEAIQYFTMLEETFPDTEYAKKAGELILKCRKRQAEHHIFVADFYWKRNDYGAAWQRYNYVCENFKDISEVYNYALAQSNLSYIEYQKTISEEERTKTQSSFKKTLKKWL